MSDYDLMEHWGMCAELAHAEIDPDGVDEVTPTRLWAAAHAVWAEREMVRRGIVPADVSFY